MRIIPSSLPRLAWLAIASLWLPTLVSPVSAGALETVTVVATRSEMSLDSLPEAVAVVSAADIRDVQASNIAEVLENLAGVDTAGGPRANAQSVVIRGIGGSRVLYTVDGSRQSFEGGHRGRFVLDPSLIKRVDMLRGPASAQYGSGAIGGVLAVHTRNADELLADSENLGGTLKSGYESAGNQWSNSVMGYASLGSAGVIAQRSRQENSDYRDGSDQGIEHTADKLDSQLLKISFELAEHHRLSALHVQTDQSNRSPSNPAQAVTDSNPLLDRNNVSANTGLSYRFETDHGYFRGVDINTYHNTTEITEDRVDAPRHNRIDFRTIGANLLVRLHASS